jgi:hypothetical protein
MSLDSLALLAMKGPQVVTGLAWLDRRQFHRRTASTALRPFVLSVEHMSFVLGHAIALAWGGALSNSSRARDDASMLPRVPEVLVTIAHFAK